MSRGISRASSPVTNPVRAIAGSEGALGVNTQATALAALAFDSVFDAARAGAQLRTRPGGGEPAHADLALELGDRELFPRARETLDGKANLS